MEQSDEFNYDGDNMLIGANRLNIDAKNYMNSGINVRRDLEEFKLDIEDYLIAIPNYEFGPRTDNLTKEGVLIDLHTNLDRINKLLQMDSIRGGKRSIRNKKTKKRKRTKRRRSKRIYYRK